MDIDTMNRWAASIALASCTALGACTIDSEASETDYDDVGRACVVGDQGQPYDVSIDFGLCLSSSCDELLEAWCTVMLDGSTLTIQASATVRRTGGPNVSCTADCGSAVTNCQTPALAPGTYMVIYGDDRADLTVPSAESTCTPDER